MNEIKDRIQQEALTRWELSGCKGLLAMGTGTGKSRIALLRMEQLYTLYGKDTRILLSVPTEKLRDENWPTEAKDWNLETIYSECVDGYCYASLGKKPSGHYHLVILDEAHHLTTNSASFLDNVIYDEIMALTGTEPDDPEKKALLKSIAPTVFKYSIDDGAKDGIVSDFKIYLIEVPLDGTDKYISAGNKKNRFYQTELDRYHYLNTSIVKIMMSKMPDKEMLLKMAFLRRAQFIKNLRSKTRVAEIVMQKIIPGSRTLIFAGSIEQANLLGGSQVYHSQSDDKALVAFKAKEISYLVAVDALNEGQNIDNLDQLLIVQLNSSSGDLKQRIGRALRLKPGETANVFVIIAQGTEDEKWAAKALSGIAPSKILSINYKNFI